jgi:peptidoglycan/LPS O-acetylase OafA/YrhL
MHFPRYSKYRPDIDGLRAIAILAVVAYHAFPNTFPGGFIGVDIFFVISGFLITGIILNGLNGGRFSFAEFYARRIKRIFPALAIVLIASLTAGWFVLTPAEFTKLSEHVVGGAGFLSNIVLWREAGYFDASAELKPLLHLWSLGIEEQFYLTWPLLLFLASKRSKVPLMMIAIGATSFAFNLHTTHSDLVAAFYSPICRFWELALGSVLAYLAQKGNTKAADSRVGGNFFQGAGFGGYTAAAGLLGLGAAMLLINTNSAFPGWWALLPTGATALLISVGPHNWISRNILSSPVMVFIGLVSFPLYLWHWPLLSFARIVGSGSLPIGLCLAVLGASLLLATLTYIAVENPIRRGGYAFAKVAALVVLMLCIGVAALKEYMRGGLDSRIGRQLPAVVASATTSDISSSNNVQTALSAKLFSEYTNLDYDFRIDANVGSCWLSEKDGPQQFAEGCIERSTLAKSAPLLFVWGDSHAARLFPGIRRVFGEKYRLAEFTRNICAPVLDLRYFDFRYGACRESNAFVLDTIRRTRPDIVVLFAVWNKYDSWLPSARVPVDLGRTLSKLREAGAPRVIVIGPPPQWTINLPRNLINIYQTLHIVPLRTRSGLDDTVASMDAELARTVESQQYATYVSALRQFCNEQGCLTRVNEEPSGLTTWDYGHFTTAGAEYLARKLPINMTASSDPAPSAIQRLASDGGSVPQSLESRR